MGFISEEIRAKAVIVYGDETCQERSQFLIQEVGLPGGILPVKNIIECGYVEETGFVWMKQENKSEHKFIGRPTIIGTEVTAYVEKYKVKKLTGVKVRELMIWLSLTDIHLEDPASGKIKFKSSSGLYRVFPASEFEIKKPKEIKESNDVKVPEKEATLVRK